jgi:1-acyl-sn-glycerol-3-phosphate acyltransferase
MGIRQTFQGIVDTARISVPTVLEAALGRPGVEKYEARLKWWAEKILRDANVDLVVRGKENAGDGSEPLIVMSNHQSLHDIPVLFCSIPGKLRMVAKKELFDVPVWGRAMRTAGFICIDRSDREQAIESLRAGSSLLRDGTRVWIAPEGTRSPTGKLGTFKSGGFRMALETGCRILPVAIDGTRRVLPARGFLVHRDQRVVVMILPPIDPKAYGVERRRDLMQDVRAAIARALGQPEREGRDPHAASA